MWRQIGEKVLKQANGYLLSYYYYIKFFISDNTYTYFMVVMLCYVKPVRNASLPINSASL